MPKPQKRVLAPSRCLQVSGVPALLIYREGQLVANFIRLTDQAQDTDIQASSVP